MRPILLLSVSRIIEFLLWGQYLLRSAYVELPNKQADEIRVEIIFLAKIENTPRILLYFVNVSKKRWN